MGNLLYSSATDRLVNLAEMRDLPMPDHGSMGRFHKPYPFYDYVSDVMEAFSNHGVEIVSEEHAVTKDNERYFGVMQIKPLQGEYISAEDWSLLVGLRGSHDQSVSRGLVIGTRVMVCSNLCFSGSLGKIATKQTTHMGDRIRILINDSVRMIPEAAQSQERQFNAMKAFQMRNRTGDAALVEIHRRSGLSGSQLSRAIREWDEPSHEEFAVDGFTAWRLLQACTEAVKPTGNNSNPSIVHDRTTIAHGVILNDVVKYSQAA